MKNCKKKIFLKIDTKGYEIEVLKGATMTLELITALIVEVSLVKLYDNQDCIIFLRDHYGEEYVNIFNYIKDGPIKADFWRACILYQFGGVYADVDVEPLVSINNFLEKNVTFMSCASHYSVNSVNPHFIISTPKNEVLKECIDIYCVLYIPEPE